MFINRVLSLVLYFISFLWTFVFDKCTSLHNEVAKGPVESDLRWEG